MKRSTSPRRMSEKRRAQLAAEGVTPYSTITAPKKPIKKKKRTKAEQTRIYGPPEFVAYLHAHPCLGCTYVGEAIQQAHAHTGGMGRKDDWTGTGPLCGTRANPVRFNLDGERAPAILEGCHSAYDHAKRSWRTKSGETFAEAQAKFFANYQRAGGEAADT